MEIVNYRCSPSLSLLLPALTTLGPQAFTLAGPPTSMPFHALRSKAPQLHPSGHPFHACDKGSIRPVSMGQGGQDSRGYLHGWENHGQRIQ